MYIFHQKMEKTRPIREEKNGKVFYCPPESATFPFTLNMIEILFPLCTLTWRVISYVSRRGRGMHRRIGEMKVLLSLLLLLLFLILLLFLLFLILYLLLLFVSTIIIPTFVLQLTFKK